MVGVKARSTLIPAETWAKDFIPYGTPCQDPCEPGNQRVDELAAEVVALRAQVEALLAQQGGGAEAAKPPRKRTQS